MIIIKNNNIKEMVDLNNFNTKIFRDGYNIVTKFFSDYKNVDDDLDAEIKQLLQFSCIKFENDDKKVIHRYFKIWIDNNENGSLYTVLQNIFVSKIQDEKDIPIIRKYINDIMQYHPKIYTNCDLYYLSLLHNYKNNNKYIKDYLSKL